MPNKPDDRHASLEIEISFPRGSTLCLVLMLRLNTVVLPMQWLRRPRCIIFFENFMLSSRFCNYCLVQFIYLPIQCSINTRSMSGIDIHFVRDQVATRQVRVLHVLPRYEYDDILTKGLSSDTFDEFRTSLSVIRPPTPTRGGGGRKGC
ncbi:hypothetical protein Tco_0485332 [Tanacetum coccineum]